MEIDTPDGVQTFGWQGPPALDTKFSQGTEVTLSGFAAGPGPGPAGPSLWSIVRSSSATAAAIQANMWAQRHISPDLEAGMSTPSDFPTLLFVNASCCVGQFSCSAASCMFGSLAADLDGEVVMIDRGGVGTVGGWSVWNGYAVYSEGGEYVFSAVTSLLGPATSESP